MSNVQMAGSLPEVLEVPRMLSVYKLNLDGSYEDDYSTRMPDVYIEDTQVCNLFDTNVITQLRETYGPLVAVMHRSRCRPKPPKRRTLMQILGG